MYGMRKVSIRKKPRMSPQKDRVLDQRQIQDGINCVSLQIQQPRVGCLLNPPREESVICAETFYTDDVNLPRIQPLLLSGSLHEIQLRNINS